MQMEAPSITIYRKAMLAGLLSVSLLLCACGFHLRGYADLNFKTIYIASNAPEIGRELRIAIKNTGVKIINDPEQADIQLNILHETKTKNILSLGSSVGTSTGAVREFELFHRVSYRMKGKASKNWSDTDTIQNRRDFSYSDPEVLGKSYEEAMLYDSMRADAVRQILRALSIYNPAVNNQPETGDSAQ